MLRRLGGCAIALALLLPTQAMASPPSSPDARVGSAVTKSRTVKLGHKPVRATTATKVRLTFKGRKGQLVHLARVDAADECGGRTLRSGGKTVKPWAQGYWRLPRTATYTAINKPCRTGEKTSVKLQVRRVVREDRLLEDAPIDVGANQRVTHLVPFRVLDGERAGLSGTDRIALIRPDRSITRDVAPDQTGFTVGSGTGAVGHDVPSPAGRYFLEVAPRAQVSLFVTMLRTVSVDGAPVVVPAGRYARLAFTGQAGQWIYPELTVATTGASATSHRLTNVVTPSDEFLPAVSVPCPGATCAATGVTQLPVSGTYVVSVPISPGDDVAVSVRVRSALRAAPATVDGPPVSLTATSPGQWVVSDLPELPRDASGGSGVTMTASNASPSLTDWRVRAVSGYGPCNPGLFNDCFDIHGAPNAFTLSPTTLSSPVPWDTFAHQAVAVLAVPPGVTGSLDLALTRPPSGS
ncbi:hypothetical protein SAMN05192575_107185 [Nocardioides alpinus]|uniref:Uncharacterized protein n=1 Tax=Nocardioides alpinus TaxID=748909 RepID=A0A1I1A383_9ACTN|nr:hypothetical protein [Nocardioides alpinus]PKH42129.1 hypothetical protein CXG46_06525 [Nocardioides alpinus]SFB32449.1 hypothetical protein SAMN05192575_107185 [Nocardioides alpinus]